MNLNLPQRKRLSAFFALSHFFRPLGYGWGTKQKKNPRNVDFPGISKRRSRDLNPGCGHPHYSLSRGAPSATWVLLHVKAGGARGIRTPGTFRYHWFSRPAPSTARPSLQVQPAKNILSRDAPPVKCEF